MQGCTLPEAEARAHRRKLSDVFAENVDLDTASTQCGVLRYEQAAGKNGSMNRLAYRLAPITSSRCRACVRRSQQEPPASNERGRTEVLRFYYSGDRKASYRLQLVGCGPRPAGVKQSRATARL